MGVVREDVVKMGFDIDFAELTQLTSTLDDIKENLTSGIGGDAFDEMTKEGKQAAKVVKDIAGCTDDIKPDGIMDTVKGLKETEEEGEDAHKQLKKIGDAKFNKTISGLKSLATTLGRVGVEAGKILAKGIAVGVAGVGVLVGQSIMSYAEYEQIVGGVDTLFGDSSGTVQKYASEAWKTAGMSANDYMQTVTSFSASLIQSLGGNTGAAAEYANMAISDMSDNANKFGTDIGSIQDAYQGFAKGNFTMLDNLKLGYGGTQEEMERLLADASAITGIDYDINSFADVVAAIHVIQENMGITGTTAAEASKTISGSFASMKAAWGNTLTSLILGGDDFDRCIDDLIEAAKTFAKNLMPALVKALEGVGRLIEEIAPIIEKELPTLIDTLLPPLIRAAGALLKGLIKALPGIISTIIDELPGVLQQVWEGIREAFGDAPGFDKVEAFFGKLKTFLEENSETIKTIIPVILGLVVAFKLFSKFKGLTGLFGGKGGSGGGFFSGLANMKPTTVLKGIANLAIIIVGLMGLAAIMMAAAPYMAKLSDLKSTMEVLLVISLVGLIGTGMAKLASYVGNIPVSTVAKGVANIAIALIAFGALAAALMWLAPYMAQLSDMQTTFKMLLMITAVGLIGSALSALAGLVGMIPVSTVAMGVANVAIALVGFGALAAVLMWLAPYMSQLSDMQTTMQILFIIGATGLVGSALAGLAGLIGMIPISAVLTGLANIALALGGFTAIVEAFGLLSDVPGFSEFLNKGGEVLTNICNILGEMVGAVIGGIGEGITASLPTIGDNLSAFASSIQPMFETFNSVDTNGLTDFALAFGSFIAVIAGEKILGLITGGIDYAGLGNDLNTMATSLGSFFNTIMTFPDGGYEKANALFECLANISSLPKEGGVVGWFQGEVDYSKMSTGLLQLAAAAGFFTTIQAIPDDAFAKATSLFDCLAGLKALPQDGGVVGWFMGETDYSKIATGLNQLAGAVSFFTAIQAIPEDAFAKATGLFNCLAGIKAMPQDGGVVGWFMGEVSFEKIATGIQTLAGAGFIAALTTISTIPESAYASLTSLFDALAGIKAMPKEGGIAGWFSGDSTTGLTNVASQLPGVATHIATFFANLGGRTDFTPIKSLFDTLSNIEIDTDAASKGFLGLGSSDLEKIGTGLSNFATKAATFFAKINSLNAENISSFFAALSTAGELPDTLSTLNETVGAQLSDLVTTADTKLSELYAKFSDELGSIILLLDATATTMYNSGVAMMTGVNNGMESMRATLIATAESIAAAVQAAYDAKLDINSPSKVMMTSGEDTIMGGVVGMRNRIPDVQAAAKDVATAATPAFTRTYSPETDSGTVYNNRTSNVEHTTISPSFNLQISGTQDDRATARKVKQWVREAMQETFSSMERKTPAAREA